MRKAELLFCVCVISLVPCCQRTDPITPINLQITSAVPSPFDGVKPGDERTIAGVKLCWCPPGKFTMGSPRGELERRPGEDQVEVTLTRGFWVGKYGVTQGWNGWPGAAGQLTEGGPGDDSPLTPSTTPRRRRSAETHRRGAVPGPRVGFRLPGAVDRLPAGRHATCWQLSSRRTSRASCSMEPKRGRRTGGRQRSALSATPGAFDMHGNIYEWCRDWFIRSCGRADPISDAKATARRQSTGDASACAAAGAMMVGVPDGVSLRFEPGGGKIGRLSVVSVVAGEFWACQGSNKKI